MKRFGGFLVETGIVSPGQLAEALLEQIKSTPPSVVVLFDQGYLDSQNVLDILSLQSDENVDFPTACNKLDLWKNEFVTVLHCEASKKRPKLGKFMLDKGWVQPKQLLDELHNFQRYCDENKLNTELKTPLVLDLNVGRSDSQEALIPVVTKIEFTPNFDNLEEESVPDFLDIFSEEKRSSMESTILSLEKLASIEACDVYNVLDAFFGEYHSLKGAARSVGAALIEKLIHEAEELLSFYKQFSTKIEAVDYEKLSSLNLTILDMLWLLRTELLDMSSEQGFWTEGSLKNEYLSLLQDVKLTLQKLNGLGYEISLDDINDEF